MPGPAIRGLRPMSIELVFCDLCNESVPAADLASGRARRLGERVICVACDAAMGGEAAAPAPRQSGEPGDADSAVPSAVPMTSPEAAAAAAPRSSWVAVLALLLAGGGSALLALRIGESEQGTERRLAALAAQRRERARELDGQLDALRTEGTRRDAARDALAAALEEQRTQLEALLGERLAELRATLAAQKTTTDALFAELADVGPAQQARLEELAERLDLQVREGRLRAEQLEELETSLRQLALAPTPVQGGSAPAAESPTPGAGWQRYVADLTDPNPGLRLDAVYAMGDSEDPAVVPHLQGMLTDGDLFVRMATCRVLMDLGARSAIPPLIDALGDDQSAVREAAMVALRELAGRNFRFDPVAPQAERAKRQAEWRAWWTREGSRES